MLYLWISPKTLGECLNRPAVLPAPGFALKLVFGEMAGILLASQKVSSQRIINTGFIFGFPELQSALKEITEHPCHQLEMEQWVPQPLEKTFPFFKEAGNLEILTPDFLGFKVLRPSTESIQEGTRIDYRLSLRGIFMGWQSLITDWKPNAGFLIWQTAESIALAGVFVFFILAWRVLMPNINYYRDLQLAGNTKAGKHFNRLRKLSVLSSWIEN